MAERENKYECPNCHSEYIQRFEVVYEGGMSDLSLTTFGVGLGDDLGVGVGGSGGISQTMLSEEVAPPLQRSVAEPALFGIVFGGVLFFVLSVFLNWFVVGLLAFLVVMAFGIVVAYANHKWNKQVWPELMDAWDHSYICLLRLYMIQ